MKIQHSLVNYIVPAIFAVFFLLLGLTRIGEKDSGCAVFFIIFLIIAVYNVIDYYTSYLELSDGMVKGKTGLIKVHKMSTPITAINGCSVKYFLCFNRIKITSGLSFYEFKNMKDVKLFEETIGKEQYRNADKNADKIVDAIKTIK